jgi:hypothetical protein
MKPVVWEVAEAPSSTLTKSLVFGNPFTNDVGQGVAPGMRSWQASTEVTDAGGVEGDRRERLDDGERGG